MDNSHGILAELIEMANFLQTLIESFASSDSREPHEQQQPHCSISIPTMNNMRPQINAQTLVSSGRLTKAGKPFLKKLTNDQKTVLRYMYSRDQNFKKNLILAGKLGITEDQLQRWYQRTEKEEKQKNANILKKRLVTLSGKVSELSQNVENLQDICKKSAESSSDDSD